ncbi:MAG: DUF899 domain-containing protein [Verrucomicrobiaceae bacterium]|nr:MAG: DUF899 domain-containing protein [Verrucomicrobiaceae bacterium]
MNSPAANGHKVASRAEWLEARKELLAKEKELTRQRDRLKEELRALPWVRVEKDYVFDGPSGKVSLSELFGENSQLIVYHFMFDPSWDEGCTGCSFISDHVDDARLHFGNRDVSYMAVSRAPLEKLEAFKERMGWKFPWVSSGNTDFNIDFDATCTSEQIAEGKATYNYAPTDEPGEHHGASVFLRDVDGTIYHTYSVYARGLEEALGAFIWMDITPKGRNEDGTMNWVRHHDRYDEGGKKSCCGCQ